MSNSSDIIVDEDVYQLCVKIATEAHKGQKRKNTKEDYINHPLRVADKFEDNFMKCLAVMHDVREDNPEYTVAKLQELKVPDIIISKLDLLTHMIGESYLDYFMRAISDLITCRIKLQDINDNLRNLSKGSLRDKYELARVIIFMKYPSFQLTEIGYLKY